MSGALTLTKQGTDQDPLAVRIAYVIGAREYISSVEPAGAPHEPLLDQLEASLNVPVSAVRAYRGSVLIAERLLAARGN